MSINFPPQEEVRLKKSPLSEVICQVKFPPILRIAKETPAEFQDAIRSRFPGLEVEHSVLLNMGISPATDNPVIEKAPKIYRFKAVDSGSNVTLAPDFFALSTSGYTHWYDFVDDFRFVEQAVQDEFHPPFANRVGLRFINRITRKNSGCKTFNELLDLFRDELTCLVRSDSWTKPDEMISQIVLSDGKAKLMLRFGFVKEGKEPFFLLDLDYFENYQLEFQDLTVRIERYHDKIYPAFRWCLKGNALDRFEPLMEK